MTARTLDEAVRTVSAAFRSHGGSVSAELVAADGSVRVRLDGLCRGCPSKAVCLEHTVRPVLLAVPGVRSVDADGGRISAEAQRRVVAFLATSDDREGSVA